MEENACSKTASPLNLLFGTSNLFATMNSIYLLPWILLEINPFCGLQNQNQNENKKDPPKKKKDTENRNPNQTNALFGIHELKPLMTWTTKEHRSETSFDHVYLVEKVHN